MTLLQPTQSTQRAHNVCTSTNRFGGLGYNTPPILTPSFIWYPMNEGSGATLNDIISGFNATLSGDYSWGSDFVSTNPQLPFGGGSARSNVVVEGMRDPPVTISVWLRSNNRSDQSTSLGYNPYPTNAVSADSPAQGGPGVGLNRYTNNGGGSNVIVVSTENPLIPGLGYTNASQSIQDNVWYNVVGVWGVGFIRCYVNGVLKISIDDTYDAPGSDNFIYIGRANDDNGTYGSNLYHDGDISDVRIWNDKALTQQESVSLFLRGRLEGLPS